MERDPVRKTLESEQEIMMDWSGCSLVETKPGVPRGRPVLKAHGCRRITSSKTGRRASTNPTSRKTIVALESNTISCSAPVRRTRATNDCIHPEEKEDYENFCAALLNTLASADPVEEVTATEFVSNAWRLQKQRDCPHPT
jgi:hypothetical protein